MDFTNKGLVVLAMAFGEYADNSKLNPNTVLGKFAAGRSREHRAPIFTQGDVAKAFPLGQEWDLAVADEKGGHLSEWQIVGGEFLEMAQARGWKKVILICAPPMEARTVLDLKRLGFEVIVDPEVRRSHSWKFWFSKDSIQGWTGSAKKWWAREVPLHLCQFFWWGLYKAATSEGGIKNFLANNPVFKFSK